ncbi:alkylated DNA nucleotide flippase Atl1 [Streptomyces pristinaespiralis]
MRGREARTVPLFASHVPILPLRTAPFSPRVGRAPLLPAVPPALGPLAAGEAGVVAVTARALSVPCGRMGRMDELPEYAERVLEVAERIPPGRVMTYGDVAEWLGEGGPRQVGRVMALYGGAVPWWRVVRSDGVLLPGHELRALDRYREEGTPLREASRAADGHVPRLDMKRARWDGAGAHSDEAHI